MHSPKHAHRRGTRSKVYAAFGVFIVFVLCLALLFPLHTHAASVETENEQEATAVGESDPDGQMQSSYTESVITADVDSSVQADVEPLVNSNSGAQAEDPIVPEGYTAFRSLSSVRAFTQQGALNCVDSVIYSLEADGDVKLLNVDPATGIATDRPSQAFRFNHAWGNSRPIADWDAPPASGDPTFNALAIGNNGDVAYSLLRQEYGQHTFGIYYWNASGRNERVYRGTITSAPNRRSNLPHSGHIVAGAMNPIGDSPFYFGGFYHQNESTYFEMWRFKVGDSEPVKVGYVYIRPTSYDGYGSAHSVNGDMAVSANGDVFILWNTGEGGKQGIVPVSREVMASANGGSLFPGVSFETWTQNPAVDQYNGIALDSGGRLLIQNTDYNTSASTIKTLDGFTFASLGSRSISGMVGAGDLASCASPSTVEVKKNIVSRVKATDQFRYGMSLDNTELAAATSGSSLGLQEQVAGPQIVMSGTTYDIWETALPNTNTDITRYKTTLSCKVKGTGEEISVVPSQTDTRRYRLTIPPRTPGVSISCEFQNEIPKGSIRWNKTDADTAELLEGSKWSLTSVTDISNSLTVEDNGTNDSDPAIGRIFVKGLLSPGKYTLRETLAPEGYIRTTAREVTVTSGSYATPVDLGNIPNWIIRSSVTWMKTDISGSALAGSEWTFTPANPVDPEMTVHDCISAPCDPTYYDTDERPGYFKLEWIKYGAYALTEKTAPWGYVKDLTVRTVNVTTDGATVVVGSISNTKAEGSVTWTKTDDRTPANALGGSVWTITPTDPTGPSIVVEDCVSWPCASSQRDTDPAKGSFRVDRLTYGRYILTETRAPVGYKISTDRHPFEINASGQVRALGPKVNHPQDSVSIPLTGGMGADQLLIAGGGLTLLALLIGPLWRRRRKL